jgi:hypothetical protein
MTTVINEQDEYMQHCGEHNHTADAVNLAVRKVVIKAKQEVTSLLPGASVSQAITNALDGEHRSVIAATDKQNLTRTLYREKEVI